MSNAFSYLAHYDTTGASYFYLALFSSDIKNAYIYIQKYIQHQPGDIRGILFYAMEIVETNVFLLH